MTNPSVNAWNYGPDSGYPGSQATLVGYQVEATDGSIGKIDEATTEADSSFIVVDTGPWIFGHRVLLPAGIIDRVDPTDEKVYVSRSRDEIKAAPDYDPTHRDHPEYRHNTTRHYYGEGR
ncbi:PRC-barrel domain containing protein [Longispora sp. NPDC051575]|uniref:PRC-barrel domain containing protein n=1 Tax=Longispora sp. NPDC051575 TaxID=3154943 RepID=UPI00343698DB